jgi:hypothetical protein
MAVETSIVVQFQDAVASTALASVQVEMDPEHENNLDSSGNLKSTFATTDKPVFILHFDETALYVSDIVQTDGSIQLIGSNVIREKEVGLFFVSKDTEVSLSYHNPTLVSTDWYGSNSCTFTISGSTAKPITGDFPCIGEGTFNVTFNNQYRLTPPSLTLDAGEIYRIGIVIIMGAV